MGRNAISYRYSQALALAVGLLIAPPLLKPAAANERIRSAEWHRRNGFQPTAARPTRQIHPEPSTGLPWPVQFVDAQRTVAQNYLQYQDYGSGAYLHGGADLRSTAGGAVVSPITGQLEAGYYSYETHEDGSMTKMWKPWSGTAKADLYFEIAVIDSNGNRFEFHHVDAMTLPEDIVRMLNSGGGTVPAGTLVGHVVRWPSADYHHVHYNIIRADGVPLNPESFSELLPDTQAPVIQTVFASYQGSQPYRVSKGQEISNRISEFTVQTWDKKDSSMYVQPPIHLRLLINGQTVTEWDFRHQLADEAGLFPDIRVLFTSVLHVSFWETIRTNGNYGKGSFLMNLKVPADSVGPYEIELSDINGNVSQFSGVLL